MKTLLDLLEENKRIPMHMPGHKRNTELAPYLERLAARYDITEIGGFDDLHSASGILKQSMERAAAMRSAKQAFYLVNGATCGLLAAIYALAAGKKVILARNCHKAVYNALELCDAQTVFVMPELDSRTGMCGQVRAADIENKITENPDAALVIVTSPTYEGVVSDIDSICRVAHNAGIPVLIDAAHGAHFGFGYGFPKDAISCGADIVVESLHKTLPSLTQTAILYVSGELVNPQLISDKLAVFETSSPSYLLMASIDGCISLLTERADELFSAWRRWLDLFYNKAGKLENLKILNNENGRFFDFDTSKIVISGADGNWVVNTLREYNIECEMASLGYAVAMTGMGDTAESVAYLADCLWEMDKKVACQEKKYTLYPECPQKVLTVKAAIDKPREYVSYSEAAGRICGQYVWAYPPGIPIILPGERISKSIAKILADYKSCGIELKGVPSCMDGKILVIK
ncbi:MAG: aminotransferase class V-fold PLP-dependent enzyme [Clostridia bacterium]|nr:aminotransferase class V-fold PLP-dependent enzyme [Clostridia bacterium]